MRQNKIKVLGITGGIGTGKSTVLDYIGKMYHARVIQADQAAHLLMEPGQVCYYKIVESFGSGILRGDQKIDREKMAAVVFSDKEKLKRLNQIVHPAVKEYIIAEIKRERGNGTVPFIVLEAALLIEDHYESICDEFWYVYADEDVRRQRLMQYRGYTAEKVKQVMKNQLRENVFRQHCQFVIDNSSNIVENTYEQIDRGLIEHEFL
ncbi:dephospho-CoA kinase [Murimonas intestini]|uniref:Dephospho-CoA kinase n=1 Tax=Murimonas intestini TaxID=1337051 RepID=A0AB73T5V2_9FIRM|nr:dephospho-CoA kinase [Murimonas intestini]MCR1840793.1 dephospho-CoA kinase [Murimonas intestini]MCR1865156.1 dephospho-CoA kinase [Murimonas intestini]MCR1883133.1 dephospho-CoA kinase [Murimonas intestini]